MLALIRLLVVLAMATLIPGPAQALTCLYRNPFTGACYWYQPELLPLPGVRWCGEQTQPGPREVMVWVDVSYRVSTWPYCMVIPVADHRAGGTRALYMWPYGWDLPYWQIASFWFGSQARGYFYSETDWGGVGTYVTPGSAWPDVRSMSISSFGLYY